MRERWQNEIQSPPLLLRLRQHERLQGLEDLWNLIKILMWMILYTGSTNFAKRKEPQQWWHDSHHRCPVLRHLAFVASMKSVMQPRNPHHTFYCWYVSGNWTCLRQSMRETSQTDQQEPSEKLVKQIPLLVSVHLCGKTS